MTFEKTYPKKRRETSWKLLIGPGSRALFATLLCGWPREKVGLWDDGKDAYLSGDAYESDAESNSEVKRYVE